jgi:hypothetical protein
VLFAQVYLCLMFDRNYLYARHDVLCQPDNLRAIPPCGFFVESDFAAHQIAELPDDEEAVDPAAAPGLPPPGSVGEAALGAGEDGAGALLYMPTTADPLLAEAQRELNEGTVITGVSTGIRDEAVSEEQAIGSAIGTAQGPNYPSQGAYISEFAKEGHWGQCFPGSFWTGRGDPTNDGQRSEGAVGLPEGARHAAHQACARLLTAAQTVDGLGFGRLCHELQMLVSTNRRWVYAAHNEIQRRYIDRARAVFVRATGVDPDMPAERFVALLHKDDKLLDAMNRSTHRIPGSRKFHAAAYGKCKSHVLARMYFDDHRRFTCAFVTTTLWVYADWGLVRLCLIADGAVREYLAASLPDQFKMRNAMFQRHPMICVKYFREWFSGVVRVWAQHCGLVDWFHAQEAHRSGVPHCHSLITMMSSGDARTVTEAGAAPCRAMSRI